MDLSNAPTGSFFILKLQNKSGDYNWAYMSGANVTAQMVKDLIEDPNEHWDKFSSAGSWKSYSDKKINGNLAEVIVCNEGWDIIYIPALNLYISGISYSFEDTEILNP